MTETEFRDFVQDFTRWLSNRELDDAAYELRQRYARFELARLRADQSAATETGPEELEALKSAGSAAVARVRANAADELAAARKADTAPQGAPPTVEIPASDIVGRYDTSDDFCSRCHMDPCDCPPSYAREVE